jgi:hypothetical protein
VTSYDINLGRSRALSLLLAVALLGLLVTGAVYVAVDPATADAATRWIGVGFAVVFGIPWLLLLLALPRLLKPSRLVLDERGVSYRFGRESTLVEWTEIAAIGIAFELPPDVPSIDLSGIATQLIMDEVLKANNSRNVALEIFPASLESLDRHPVLAGFRKEHQPPRAGLSSVRWRMPMPMLRTAKQISTAAQALAGPSWLGWFQRPWGGSILGRRDKVRR